MKLIYRARIAGRRGRLSQDALPLLPPQGASALGAPLVGLRPEFAWRQRAPTMLRSRPSCLVWPTLLLLFLAAGLVPARLAGQAPAASSAAGPAIATSGVLPSTASIPAADARPDHTAAGAAAVCNRRKRWIQASVAIVGAVIVNFFLSSHFRREAPCDLCVAQPSAMATQRRAMALAGPPGGAPEGGSAGRVAAIAAAPMVSAILTDPATATAGPQCMSNRKFWTITTVAIAAGTALNVVLSHVFRKQCVPNYQHGPLC